MKINNLPANYTNFPYIVVIRDGNSLWYWGAFHDRRRANEVALEEGGITLTLDLVEQGA